MDTKNFNYFVRKATNENVLLLTSPFFHLLYIFLSLKLNTSVNLQKSSNSLSNYRAQQVKFKQP